MDAFIEAAETARSRLIVNEGGKDVSWREVLRRAGIGEHGERSRPGASYHLNPNRHRGDKAHQVPAWLVDALESVLPVARGELAQAARVAAGFNHVEERPGPSVIYMVQRFYGGDEVTDEERAEVTAQLLQILAEQTRRQTGGPATGGSGPSHSAPNHSAPEVAGSADAAS